jgi:hypothetical protein
MVSASLITQDAGARTNVDRFLEAIVTARITGCGAFAEDAVLDATTPDWRFTVVSGANIESQLSSWYADPGVFVELHRTPVADGELIEFVLDWTEQSGPHRCHQMHLIRLGADGLIESDTVFCGGRWDSELMAEMARAETAR